MSRDTWSKWHRIYSVNLILYKSSDLKPLSPLEVLGEFAKNRFGKYFPVAVRSVFLKKKKKMFFFFFRGGGSGRVGGWGAVGSGRGWGQGRCERRSVFLKIQKKCFYFGGSGRGMGGGGWR